MWLNPQPTELEYQTLYSHIYFSKQEEPASEAELSWLYEFSTASQYETDEMVKRQGWYEARMNRLKSWVPSGGTLLDVGAATGDFLAVAREMGWTVHGLELSRFACDRARSKYGIELQCTDLEHFDAQGSTYDVVHLSHVFEHLLDPVSSLHHLRRIMHDRSILVIEVPNQFRATVTELAYRIKRINQLPRSVYSIHHPYFYGATQLSQMLMSNGFEVIDITTHFPERWGKHWKQQLLRIVECSADRLHRGGENIEAIARPIPINYQSTIIRSDEE